MAEYIDIEKDLVPYRFDISLGAIIYTFEVNYNSEADFFILSLERDQEVLAAGEKIVYGVPLFIDIADSRFPTVSITPLDLSGSADTVSMATLSETVFLYLGDDGDA